MAHAAHLGMPTYLLQSLPVSVREGAASEPSRKGTTDRHLQDAKMETTPPGKVCCGNWIWPPGIVMLLIGVGLRSKFSVDPVRLDSGAHHFHRTATVYTVSAAGRRPAVHRTPSHLHVLHHSPVAAPVAPPQPENAESLSTHKKRRPPPRRRQGLDADRAPSSSSPDRCTCRAGWAPAAPHHG
jgi:hypothetical protein